MVLKQNGRSAKPAVEALGGAARVDRPHAFVHGLAKQAAKLLVAGVGERGRLGDPDRGPFGQKLALGLLAAARVAWEFRARSVA